MGAKVGVLKVKAKKQQFLMWTQEDVEVRVPLLLVGA